MSATLKDLEGLIGDNISYIRKIVFSVPRNALFIRAAAKPVAVKGETLFSFETFTSDNKAVTKNIPIAELPGLVCDFVSNFGQTSVVTAYGDITVLFSKKGKLTLINRIKIPEDAVAIEPKTHDRQKKYIIDPADGSSFLSALGVCDENGNLFDKKRAKFRQINRFVELLDDVYGSLPRDGILTVCDLCCGKSYLTFAVYYYLTALKGRKVRMYGVDLKAGVIEYCAALAEKLRWDGLTFLCMDISEFECGGTPDLVISLHACDTATDVVLAYAIGHNAGMILSTPCCHHEIFHQMKSEKLRFIERHSILKQKLCDAATDSLRALLLEANGYNTEVIELIDPEDTPKNAMIRAVKSRKILPGKRENALKEYKEAVSMLGVDPTLGRLLGTE